VDEWEHQQPVADPIEANKHYERICKNSTQK
jgi:hypothetical protein